MAVGRDDLMTYLAGLGIETETVEHAPVATVAEAKIARGDLAGAHIKNLFLKDKKGQLWLVVAPEDRAIDMKDLRRRIGAATLSFGKAELLQDALGVEPGAVTPFAVLNDTRARVRVVIDPAVLEAGTVNCHPLVNTATTAIAADDLMRFLAATGHAVDVVEV